MNIPWVIIGDFNEILFNHEKEGGNPQPDGHLNAFRDALMDCGLEDLGFSSDKFTWRRGRIRERLDGAMATGLKGHLSISTFLIYNDMTMFCVN
jgi:hypothetical protein